MRPPTYVAFILPPFVKLESLKDTDAADLKKLGVRLERLGARFQDSPGDLLSNEHLISILEAMIAAGVHFLEDYQQGWSPADIMRELQSRGKIKGPFKAIAWRGEGAWFTESVAPKKRP